MTSSDFINLPLKIGFTAIELYNIADSLFVTSNLYRKKGLDVTANNDKELREKILLYLKENVKIHY